MGAEMFEKEIKVLRFMQGYGDMLLEDIAPQEMCIQPTPRSNHPAWVIGHLAVAADTHSQYAGGTPQLDAWHAMFGMGTQPEPSLGSYPSKDEIIAAWHAANDRLIDAVGRAEQDRLGQPTQGPLGDSLPVVADFLAFSMTGHTSMHLGQLSAWRRAAGKPVLF